MPYRPPVKLLVDAHVFDSEYQGTRTFIKGLYTELAKKSDIQLFLAAHNTVNLRQSFGSNRNIRFLKYTYRSGFLRLLLDIPAMIKDMEIDYAHFQYIVPPIKKCRYIVTIHDVLFEDFPHEFSSFYRYSKKYLYKMGANKADILTTVSAFSKHSIQKHLGISSPVHVVPNGINSQYFEPYEKDAAKAFIATKYGMEKLVLYVSRIEQRKNHHLLLQAWLDLELYKKGYHLVFLGHKSLKVPLLEKALDNLSSDIKRFIYMSSTVDDADLLQFYQAASVFAYPSKAEGFGIPPLEAAALGIPVICSNASAMSDFTFFGENHIDPSNFGLLKSTLARVIDSPPGQASLTKISEIIRQNYSWKHCADTFYQALIASKNTTFDT